MRVQGNLDDVFAWRADPRILVPFRLREKQNRVEFELVCQTHFLLGPLITVIVGELKNRQRHFDAVSRDRWSVGHEVLISGGSC